MRRLLQKTPSGLLHQPLLNANKHFSARAGSILLRDYIHEQLYGDGCGYFNQERPPVAPLSRPLAFNSFLGKADYLAALADAGTQAKANWLTPSEIFTPHYGSSIASYILKEQIRNRYNSLHIYELGAGTGTLAKDILDYLKATAPEVYQTCQFTSCEISPQLAKQQQHRVAHEGGHASHFTVEQRDAADRASWGRSSPEPCFILGMEVLDNCAHDKVVKGKDGAWMQEEIANPRGTPAPVLTTLADPIIKFVLDCALDCKVSKPPLWERLYDLAVGYPTKGPYTWEKTIFLPTKAAMLFKTLQAARPNHHLIMADFNHLPDVVIPGRQAPLVTSKVDRDSQDHSSYLIDPGTADILFPTDFDLLCDVYRSASGAEVVTSAESLLSQAFLTAHADKGATRARNGYNPLLEDFSNTSFFLGHCQAI